MGKVLSVQRRRLWQTWHALELLVRRMQRSEPMCPGTCYLLRRRCGKPGCRCNEGDLHGTWVLTRSEQGHARLYSVPAGERGQIRRLTRVYCDWQRSRAGLVKLFAELIRRLDAQAEERTRLWPERKGKGKLDGSADY